MNRYTCRHLKRFRSSTRIPRMAVAQLQSDWYPPRAVNAARSLSIFLLVDLKQRKSCTGSVVTLTCVGAYGPEERTLSKCITRKFLIVLVCVRSHCYIGKWDDVLQSILNTVLIMIAYYASTIGLPRVNSDRYFIAEISLTFH